MTWGWVLWSLSLIFSTQSTKTAYTVDERFPSRFTSFHIQMLYFSCISAQHGVKLRWRICDLNLRRFVFVWRLGWLAAVIESQVSSWERNRWPQEAPHRNQKPRKMALCSPLGFDDNRSHQISITNNSLVTFKGLWICVTATFGELDCVSHQTLRKKTDESLRTAEDHKFDGRNQWHDLLHFLLLPDLKSTQLLLSALLYCLRFKEKLMYFMLHWPPYHLPILWIINKHIFSCTSLKP